MAGTKKKKKKNRFVLTDIRTYRHRNNRRLQYNTGIVEFLELTQVTMMTNMATDIETGFVNLCGLAQGKMHRKQETRHELVC